jgi:hypothetical protein
MVMSWPGRSVAFGAHGVVRGSHLTEARRSVVTCISLGATFD